MPKSYKEITTSLSKNLAELRKEIPDVAKGFSALATAALTDGALDKKTKELIALAIGVTDQQHKSLAETVKKDAKTSLIFKAQPGATLKIANELAKKHYDTSVNNMAGINS